MNQPFSVVGFCSIAQGCGAQLLLFPLPASDCYQPIQRNLLLQRGGPFNALG